MCSAHVAAKTEDDQNFLSAFVMFLRQNGISMIANQPGTDDSKNSEVMIVTAVDVIYDLRTT